MRKKADVDHTVAIQRAERELNEAREAQAGDNFPNTLSGMSPGFWTAFDDLLLAVRDGVRHAESEIDGATMRRLLPILDGASQLILTRRLSADVLNPATSILARFLRALDNLIPAIRSLHVSPRSPAIQTPGQMIKDGCATPAVMQVWRHLGVVRIEAIRAGLEPDVSPDELAEHPEIVAWRQTQAEMPDFDDSVLQGECRSAERSRERHGLPVTVG